MISVSPSVTLSELLSLSGPQISRYYNKGAEPVVPKDGNGAGGCRIT